MALKSTPGYDYLMKIAEAQVTNRRQDFELTPLRSLDETLGQEFKKGEISGILLFMNMVDIRIENLQTEIKEELGDEQTTED